MYMSYVLDFRQELLRGTFVTYKLNNFQFRVRKACINLAQNFVTTYSAFYIVVEDDQCFILTTDADVKFTHWSVEALIDQITEDPKTGAVCARTHPLGDGPVVWYQIFDYAIGHWFQKVRFC